MKSRWMICVLGLMIVFAAFSDPADARGCRRNGCPPCPCSEDKNNTFEKCPSGDIDPVLGCELYTADAPGSGLWRISPTYNSAAGRWNTSADIRLVQQGPNYVQFMPDAFVTMEFHRDNGGAPWVAWGETNEPDQSAYVLATANITGGNITLYHNTPHGKTTYTFYGFQSTSNDGRLISISIGDLTNNPQQIITYSYNTGGACTGVLDEHGRTITYQYITGTNYISKVIESNPAAASPSSNNHGRVTWFVWEGDRLTLMEVGMPKTANADPGDASTPPVSADYY